MTRSIPKPDFPKPRRRSSIGQAAALAGGEATPSTADADTQAAASAPVSDEQGGTAAPASPAADTTALVSVERPEEPSPPAATSAGPRVRATSARNGGVAKQAPTAQAPNKRLIGSKDILLSIPEDLKERMVNTLTWTQPYTGIGQQQKFIRKAITELCESLEQRFNNGEPYPPPARPEE
jgi:hypothetical protein